MTIINTVTEAKNLLAEIAYDYSDFDSYEIAVIEVIEEISEVNEAIEDMDDDDPKYDESNYSNGLHLLEKHMKEVYAESF